MCARSLQLCLTFCDPMDCSPPSSSVHGVLQARKLEWLAMPSSRGSSPARDQTHVSCLAGGVFTAEHRRSPGERYTNLINRKSFPPYYPTRKCSTIFRSQILSLPGTPAQFSLSSPFHLGYLQQNRHTVPFFLFPGLMSSLYLEYLPYIFSQPPAIPTVL